MLFENIIIFCFKNIKLFFYFLITTRVYLFFYFKNKKLFLKTIINH